MDNIKTVTVKLKNTCVLCLKTGINAIYIGPFHGLATNTHKRYILRHYINVHIVSILQKTDINSMTCISELKIKLHNYYNHHLVCLFWYFLSTESKPDLQIGLQSSTCNMWEGSQKKLYLAQWEYIANLYPVNVIYLLK